MQHPLASGIHGHFGSMLTCNLHMPLRHFGSSLLLITLGTARVYMLWVWPYCSVWGMVTEKQLDRENCTTASFHVPLICRFRTRMLLVASLSCALGVCMYCLCTCFYAIIFIFHSPLFLKTRTGKKHFIFV